MIAGSKRGPGGAGGSATVEVVVLVPILLVFLAAVWDIRQFIAYRTELAREMYVVAEAIADDREGEAPLESVLELAQSKFEDTSVSGSIHAAVVVRGWIHTGGEECVDDEWCRPMVTVTWPASSDDTAGTWSRDGSAGCARAPGVLPQAGIHFRGNEPVLPDEGADPDGDGPLPAPQPPNWVSRNLTDTEWWVVVDTCIEPEPGLFIGHLVNWADDMLDTRTLAWQRRVAWGSIHDLADCDWCEPDEI